MDKEEIRERLGNSEINDLLTFVTTVSFILKTYMDGESSEAILNLDTYKEERKTLGWED